MIDEIKIIGIIRHGLCNSTHAIEHLAKELSQRGIIIADEIDDKTETINIKYEEIPRLNFDTILTRYDEDSKFNWNDYKINKNIYNNSTILNNLLKSKINKRNIFKNKRR